MSSIQSFIGAPLYYKEKKIYIKIPKLKDVIGNSNYSIYKKIFTTSQEEIWDILVSNTNIAPTGEVVKNAPTPFEFLLNNCYQSKEFMQKAKDAFYFWTEKEVTIFPTSKMIVFNEELLSENNNNKESRFLNIIQEEDYFVFQNLIRAACGDDVLEPPNPNENEKVALIKAKGRYRERIKEKKGNKNALSLQTIVAALCCMNLNLTPLNIGDMPFPSLSVLFEMAQKKEKYETDLKIATAGFGNKKIKPKYWLQEYK